MFFLLKRLDRLVSRLFIESQIFQIAIASSKELCCIAWMKNCGHIAIGGDEGSLRVLQLPSEGGRWWSCQFDKFQVGRFRKVAQRPIQSIQPSWRPHIQRLACSHLIIVVLIVHSIAVKVELADWNEVHQKLATSDDAGLIVVWISHQSEETWFEEMWVLLLLLLVLCGHLVDYDQKQNLQDQQSSKIVGRRTQMESWRRQNCNCLCRWSV